MAFKGIFIRFKPMKLKSGIFIPPPMRKAVKTHENALKWGLFSTQQCRLSNTHVLIQALKDQKRPLNLRSRVFCFNRIVFFVVVSL